MTLKIPRKIETQWRQIDRRFLLYASGISIAVMIGIVWLVMTIHPLPPRSISMVAGPEGGAFAEYGKQYQSILARDGIKVHLISTDGAIDNLAQLNDPQKDVQVGLLEGGITTSDQSPQLVSLGTLGYEPLWFFVRDLDMQHGLSGLRGKRISIGPLGSDTRYLSTELLKRNAMDFGHTQILNLTPKEAGEALLNHRIDAALILSSWLSPTVQELVHSPNISIVNFPRVNAYVALYPYLYKLVFPAGVADLATNRPPTDVNLLATKSSLIVRRDLHPAIQYLLLEAAAEIHSKGTIFWKSNEFPASDTTDLPLSRDARRFYKSGAPLLQRYLPFWLAVLVEQFLILLLPLAGLAYPLIKGIAALYQWSIQRRVFVIYTELWSLENKAETGNGKEAKNKLLNELERLQQRAAKIRVSTNYIPMLYTLRDHIDFVCEKLEKDIRKV